MKIEEALADGMEVDLPRDPDDLARLDYFNLSIEETTANLKGNVFDLKMSLEMITLPVAAEIKRCWESQGWVVGVFPAFLENGKRALQMVFSRTRQAAIMVAKRPAAAASVAGTFSTAAATLPSKAFLA